MLLAHLKLEQLVGGGSLKKLQVVPDNRVRVKVGEGTDVDATWGGKEDRRASLNPFASIGPLSRWLLTNPQHHDPRKRRPLIPRDRWRTEGELEPLDRLLIA